jgi:hypothetical protein
MGIQLTTEAQNTQRCLGRRSLSAATAAANRMLFFIFGDVLARLSFAEKLTVMFSEEAENPLF